jgi:hypothetical protein
VRNETFSLVETEILQMWSKVNSTKLGLSNAAVACHAASHRASVRECLAVPRVHDARARDEADHRGGREKRVQQAVRRQDAHQRKREAALVINGVIGRS